MKTKTTTARKLNVKSGLKAGAKPPPCRICSSCVA